MSDNDEFIHEFLEECEENLDQLERDLVALEADPHDADRLASIFRTIHTIKGTSGFFGFARLGSLAHDGESLLGRLRDGELVLNQSIATALLDLVDGVREMLASIQQSGQEGAGDYQELSARLIQLALSTDASASAPSEDGERRGIQDDDKRVSPDPAVGADRSSFATKAVPTEPAPKADEASPSAPTGIEDYLAGIKSQQEQRADFASAAIEPPNSGGSLRSTPTAQETTTDEPSVPQRSGGEAPPTAPAPSGSSPAAHVGEAGEGSIRVDVRLLDELVDLAGELVLARNQLNQLGGSRDDPSLQQITQRLNLVTSALQEGVMQTRMQPISAIWGKFPRVVRDLAVACGKEVDLQREGEDTELDRSLLETIRDPLTHLIRNAVDHGIETPAERLAAGKPRAGRLLLRAAHESGQVTIEISDDGRGIDVERVREKAMEKRIVGPEQAARMGERELLQMIFAPGFSTAQAVTDVSGRGVGMDVVKTNIEKIGGKIELRNLPGRGTTVRITIPLTLAIIPALIVGSGGDRFAIPQAGVIELLKYGGGEGEAIEWVRDAPVCRLRGELLPLVSLAVVLQLAPHLDVRERMHNIVVMAAEGRRFGLLVESVVNIQEIVVKPLGKLLKSMAVYAGATIMGDGTVALILDIVGLARKAGMSRLAADLPPLAPTTSEPAALDAFLLCEIDEQRPVALPLAQVERLEEFRVDQLEHADGREVVQYGAGILPLVRLTQLASAPAKLTPDASRLTVVVHRAAAGNVGVVVARLLDIVACPAPPTRGKLLGSSVIGGRVTDVLDLAEICRAADAAYAGPRLESARET